ncbi:MAG: phosphatase PAP2 family protein [Prevotellaceae bacterium]|jgi:membrane-associated phospholipid phosphatase|nr:phosphatase PAP2 family protein [Prevotellaceae bacterium]
MAIKVLQDIHLLRKVESGKGLFAVEQISLVYNLLTTVVILFLFQRMEHPVRMLEERLLIASVTFLLVYVYRLHPCKASAFLRIVFQMSLLSYWYPDTFEFNRLAPNLDYLFASAEQWLFNGQPSVNFSHRFPSIWISEPLNLGYFFYYPMIILVGMYYFLFRYDLFAKIAFVLVGCFFVYYIIYIIIPCAGPQFYFPVIGEWNVEHGIFPPIGNYFDRNSQVLLMPEYNRGVFYNLVKLSQQVGERPTAAFPSSHVGISTILMIMAWRANRHRHRLFFFLLPFYVLLCTATVYIQAHYLIDSLVGFLSAIPLYIVVTRIYKRWYVRERTDFAVKFSSTDI